MLTRLRALHHDEGGQDLVEYALLAALLSIVSIVALQILGFTLWWNFIRLRFAVGGSS